MLVGVILIQFGLRFGQLRSTRYSLTNQRLIIEAGLFSRACVAYEVRQLGDAVISGTPLMRTVGVADLTILQPCIRLRGIRNAEAVRDLIRSASQVRSHRTDPIG